MSERLICMLPWLELEQPFEFCGYWFETFNLGNRSDKRRSSPEQFAALAAIYREHDGSKLRRWTLAGLPSDKNAFFLNAEHDYQ